MALCKIRGKKDERRKGSVTILVSLLLVPVLLFTGIMVEFARVKLYESQAAFTADAYANSILGSFNKELFDMYGLFGYMPDEDREKALAELAVKSFIPDKLDADDPEYEKLVKKIYALFNESGVDYTAPYSNAKVNYSYEVAQSADGKEGKLGTNAILKSQISQYTATRLPTYLIEEMGDDASDMLNAIDYISNLSNYSEIVSLKTQLDAKIEKFYTLLHAYYDDMNAIKPQNMANWTSDYYGPYGAYGTEDVYHLIGELYYDGDRKFKDGTGDYPESYKIKSYMEVVSGAHGKMYDLNEELNGILSQLEHPTECQIGTVWSMGDDGYWQSEHIDHPDEKCINVFSSKLVENAQKKLNDLKDEYAIKSAIKPDEYAFEYYIREDLSVLEANMYLLKTKLKYGNYFTRNINNDSIVDKIDLIGIQQFDEIGAALENEKAKIGAELKKFEEACNKAIEDGCAEEIISRMRADYSSLSMFTEPDFKYQGNAEKYIADVNDIIFQKILAGHDIDLHKSYSEYDLAAILQDTAFYLKHFGEREMTAIGDEINGSMLDADNEIIDEDIDKLRAYIDDLIGYAGSQLGSGGTTPVPVFDIVTDPIRDLEEYNAYEIDSMDLFGHNVRTDYMSPLEHNTELAATSGKASSKDTTLYDKFYRNRKIYEQGLYNEVPDANGANNDETLLEKIRVKTYKLSSEQRKWFSIKNDDKIGQYHDSEGKSHEMTNALFYQNLRDTFVSATVKEEKANIYVNKAKALLNAVNDMDFLSYGNMPTMIDSKVYDSLSSNSKSNEQREKIGGFTDMLLMAEEFFSNFNMENFVRDQTNNVMVMLYDYNMFSCNTTDREYIGTDDKGEEDKKDKEKNKVKDEDKSSAMKAIESNSEVSECTALTVLSEGKTSVQLSNETNSSGPKNNTQVSENKDAVKKLYKPNFGKEHSMTNQTYAQTSALYYCGDENKEASKGEFYDLGGSELEYIYGGDAVADNNLASVRMTIIMERLVLNYISTYTISELDSVLREINIIVSAAFTPVAGIVTESLLRLAIAVLETNSDMLILLAAGKITLIKTALTQLSSYSMLKDLLVSDGAMEEAAQNGNGSPALEDKEGSGTYQVSPLPDKEQLPSAENVAPESTNAAEASKSMKFPEINLNYKQYLAINLALFTNPEDRLSRTRDLIDLNINMKNGLLVREPGTKGNLPNYSNRVMEVIRFSTSDGKKPDDFFVTAEQITTIKASCTISLAPFFSSASVESLTGDKATSEEVQSYLSDERTFSIIRGY